MSAEQPIILITGVSSGIGHGLAQSWLDSGATVLGLSRRAPSELSKSAGLRFASVDLVDYDRVPAALDEVLTGIERLDRVILNAGILGGIGDLASTALEDAKRVVEINLWSNKVILDDLFRRRIPIEQVVTISSGASINGSRGWGAYSISKAALNMLTLLYAREFPRTHFCALAPGLVDTGMQDYLCGLPPDERFPSLEVLKSKRGTTEMPDATTAAVDLRRVIESLPEAAESGAFRDIRHPPPGRAVSPHR